MPQNLEPLRAEVERIKTVKESVKTLLSRLAAKIEELKNNPVELAALAAEVRTHADDLEAAVVANTPSEEPSE